jgi:hypothetical protein
VSGVSTSRDLICCIPPEIIPKLPLLFYDEHRMPHLISKSLSSVSPTYSKVIYSKSSNHRAYLPITAQGATSELPENVWDSERKGFRPCTQAELKQKRHNRATYRLRLELRWGVPVSADSPPCIRLSNDARFFYPRPDQSDNYWKREWKLHGYEVPAQVPARVYVSDEDIPIDAKPVDVWDDKGVYVGQEFKWQVGNIVYAPLTDPKSGAVSRRTGKLAREAEYSVAATVKRIPHGEIPERAPDWVSYRLLPEPCEIPADKSNYSKADILHVRYQTWFRIYEEGWGQVWANWLMRYRPVMVRSEKRWDELRYLETWYTVENWPASRIVEHLKFFNKPIPLSKWKPPKRYTLQPPKDQVVSRYNDQPIDCREIRLWSFIPKCVLVEGSKRREKVAQFCNVCEPQRSRLRTPVYLSEPQASAYAIWLMEEFEKCVHKPEEWGLERIGLVTWSEPIRKKTPLWPDGRIVRDYMRFQPYPWTLTVKFLSPHRESDICGSGAGLKDVEQSTWDITDPECKEAELLPRGDEPEDEQVEPGLEDKQAVIDTGELTPHPKKQPRYKRPSRRQRKIFKLKQEGYTNKEIAQRIGKDESTVKRDLRNVRQIVAEFRQSEKTRIS